MLLDLDRSRCCAFLFGYFDCHYDTTGCEVIHTVVLHVPSCSLMGPAMTAALIAEDDRLHVTSEYGNSQRSRAPLWPNSYNGSAEPGIARGNQRNIV